MSRIFRAAVVQDAPAAFDLERSLARAVTLVAEAAGQGAQLVVFPEAFLSGYPKGLDFGARVGVRSPEGRDLFRRYYENALDVPGPATSALGAAARAHHVHLVVGVIERAGGTLYCSVLFFGPDGQLLGKHRKVMPTAMERLIWGFGDGSTLTVLPTPLGRLGAAICWENYMPQLRLALYGQGVQLYCAPTVDDRETWLPTMRHIALEGRCFVLSACQFARRRDFPPDVAPIQGDDPDTVLIRGGSCIVSPLGALLAGPVFDQATILTAEIDVGAISRATFDLDVVGHYARPDLFQLTVNTSPTPAVRFTGDAVPELHAAPTPPSTSAQGTVQPFTHSRPLEPPPPHEERPHEHSISTQP
jgi:nitrilase